MRLRLGRRRGAEEVPEGSAPAGAGDDAASRASATGTMPQAGAGNMPPGPAASAQPITSPAIESFKAASETIKAREALAAPPAPGSAQSSSPPA
jgi:hypothetical protein